DSWRNIVYIGEIKFHARAIREDPHWASVCMYSIEICANFNHKKSGPLSVFGGRTFIDSIGDVHETLDVETSSNTNTQKDSYGKSASRSQYLSHWRCGLVSLSVHN